MNRAISCAPFTYPRRSNWPVTPEVAGSSPVAPVLSVLTMLVLFSLAAWTTGSRH